MTSLDDLAVGLSILVVEDEALIAEEIRQRLTRLHCQVVGVADRGDEAIKIATLRRPDLILMDICIKGSRDGIEVAKQIYEDLGIPIIFLTAHSDQATLERAQAVAPFGYVIKPFQERDLWIAIQMAWQRHQREREQQQSGLTYATIVAGMADGVIAIDVAGRVRYMNPAAEMLTDWPQEDALGLAVEQAAPVVEERTGVSTDHPALLALRCGSVIRTTLHLMTRQSNLIPVEATASPVLGTTGGITGATLVLRNLTERNSAQEHIVRLAALVENAADAIIAKNLNGVILSWNAAAERLFGYPAEEAIGQPITLLVPAGLEDEERCIMDWVRSGRQVESMETIRRRKDGSSVEISMTISPVRDAAGNVIGAAKVARDISESKRAERILRESEERFRNAFDDAGTGMALVGLDGRWLRVNRSLCSLVGYTAEEMLEIDFQTITHPDDLAADLESLHQMLAGTIPYYHMEKRYLHKQGNVIWILLSVSLVRDASNAPLYFITQIQDITARKEAEQALRHSEELYRALTHNFPNGSVVLFDHDLRYLLVDGAAFRAVGLSKEELEGRTIRETFPGETCRIIEPAFRAALEGDVNRIEVTFAENTYSVDVLPIRNEQRQVVCGMAMFQDISEGKRATARLERQFQRLHALRAIDLAITASLDLRLSLEVVLTNLRAQLDVEGADILLYNPYSNTLEYATEPVAPAYTQRIPQYKLGEGRPGLAALTRSRVSEQSIQEQAASIEQEVSPESALAYHAVPLMARGEVKGVLEVFYRETQDRDGEWIQFLDTLAGQAAIAIDNASLFEDLKRANTELLRAYDATIEGWSRALDLRDEETEGHSRRVTEMTMKLAKAVGISDPELVHIRRGALLHDIGKLGVPDSILHKPGKLTEDEWKIMRNHTDLAYEMLAPIDFLRPAIDIPYNHHEKWDGTGYPRKLKGRAIPLAARLFALADVWDALTNARPYRAAWPPEKVREHIVSLSGTHFDPELVEVFCIVLDEGKLGT
jgi:PAS domain S-box-containing protein/putative nucleotidyltransferase with HDIG domain